ncbi:MAG: NosD domain-containing protein, partial [Methanosarcina sp.]|nr:NosD domain-containing protein [Methanosarcina sp.]
MWQVKRTEIVLFAAVFAIYLAIAGSASAATIYVDDDGSADYATIQAAVNYAKEGDTISVKSGTYSGDITITVPNLVLVSSSPYNAIIKAKGNAFNLDANYITIKNFNIIGPGGSGSSGIIDNSFFCTIQNNKISNFNTGIGVYTGNEGGGGSIINNDISDCDDGILLWSSNDNKISGNRLSNCKTGLDMVDSYDTIIYNNNFNNTLNVQFMDISTWNTTKTPGKNIVGGPYIGGNYWATPKGDGFSQTHSDSNGDGICEEPYYMNEVNIDYMPLFKSVIGSKAPEEVGVYNNAGTWALWNTATKSADIVGFGWAGTKPIVGDWEGDGGIEVGIYNNAGNNFMLQTDAGLKVIGLGWSGVTPVVGDWNGDGKDDVGVYNNAGTWALWNTATNSVDIVGFGWAGSKPIVGDWDGDGVTEVGIYNNAGNNFMLQTDAGLKEIGLGWEGVTPVVGDWNGDGKDDVGVYNNAGTWALWNTATNSVDIVGFGW